jgi:hypothetical protein
MLRNHWFNVLVAILVVTVIALTIREASATTSILTKDNSTKGTETLTCLSLPSRYSLRTEYVKEADMWMIRTEDGPTGVDGGFTILVSDYRTCSR